MASDVRLKQKCNKLIDNAQKKKRELQELQDVLYDLLEQKANLEVRLQENKEITHDLKWVPAIREPGTVATISYNSSEGMVKHISEQELLNIFIEFGNQLNIHLDEAIDRKLEDRIDHLPRNKKYYEDKKYLGLSDEVAIIYEHGKFYEIIRKIGYIVVLGFILAILALAVISMATLI